MQIQVNTDNATPGRERLIESVTSDVESRFSRFAERITRIEVHLSDVNADRGGDDKRCLIEVRANGLAPVSASAQAGTFDQAVTGAVSKVMTVLERTFGRLTSRKGH